MENRKNLEMDAQVRSSLVIGIKEVTDCLSSVKKKKWLWTTQTYTIFKQPKKHMYTWKAPVDGHNYNIWNHVDYILIRKRFCNAKKCIKTYRGADISLNHNPDILIYAYKLLYVIILYIILKYITYIYIYICYIT